MTGVPAGDLRAYFKEAQSWDADRLATARSSARLAWGVAALASLLAGCSLIAVITLTPLKSVEPYVVRVDRATGAVEVLTALKDVQPRSYDEAVTKSFLATYVRAREGWLPSAAEANFRQVSIMSTAQEQQRWANAFAPSNPKSPQVMLGPSGEAQVEVRAISFVSPSVANVRYHRQARHGAQIEEGDWIATIAFTYAKAPMREVDRLDNPLGFQVASYRADPELIR